MSSAIKNSTVEELKLKNTTAQLERRYDRKLREMEDQHMHDVRNVQESNEDQLRALRRAYEVRISQDAEALEEKLHAVRLSNQNQVTEAERTGTAELNQIKQANAMRLQAYKKNADDQLAKTQTEHQLASLKMHEQTAKAARQNRDKGTPS